MSNGNSSPLKIYKKTQELNSLECLGKTDRIQIHRKNAKSIKTGRKHWKYLYEIRPFTHYS